MRSSHHSQVFVRVLLVLVPLLGSAVKGQLCPPGQVTHDDQGTTRCCLPVDCDPNYYVEFCKYNGTQDTCKRCPSRFKLLKRTSSFAVESCHSFRLSEFPECKQLPGALKPSEEDVKHCFCNLEDGYFYLKAENTVAASSNCQPSNECMAGEQPTQTGMCEPCPENTVQDVNRSFKLCRPQRNCAAMRLDTESLGDATKETVCAKPPPPPSIPPTNGNHRTSTPAPTTKQTSTAAPSTTDSGSVRPIKTGTTEENFPLMLVIAIIICLVVLGIVIAVVLIARRRGWFAGSGRCARDTENPSCNGTQYPMSDRSDNDNTSDNSCCACADSCLASPSSSKGSGGGGASGKTGATPWGQTKNSKGLPLPMLEAYMNMNGKCGKESPGDGSLSEPLYNSISLDSSGKLGSGDNMATYKNVNGVPPTMLRQEDFYNYPNKVRLSSSDDDDDVGHNTMSKDREIHRQQQQQRRAAGRGGGEDFTETDPLLPNSENTSCGVPTPVVSPGLRGILRNGPNRQEPRGGRGGGWAGGTGGGGRGEAAPVAGNRPHLSMLLSSTEESATPDSGDSCQGNNVPHLSQLMSNSPHSRSAPSTGSQPPIPPPPQPEVPEQHVHELPQQLQHLLQQQRLMQQQLQQQEGSGGPRLVPVSQPQLNPSLVQMEELKPVMPLNPSPTNPDNPALLPGVTPTGAANVTESKGRSESPARISPSQQEEVRGKGGGVSWKPAQTTPEMTSSPAMARKEAGVENEINEQTFRKQAGLACSPGDGEDDEETAHKSVGGSSGLGDSLDLSSLSDEGRKSRTPYRRSVSDVTRSVSPSQPLPPLRSISIPSPEEKHRPFAVVKPMQSDQSLNGSLDTVNELTQPLDSAGRHYPLHSLRPHTPRRQTSQDSDPELTRPKTPDRLSEDENEENEMEDNREQDASDERTRANFYGNNDSDRADDNEDGASGKDKTSDGRSSEG